LSRNPTFSGVFEKNNFGMIGSVFMQREIGEKVEIVIFYHQTDVPDGCRYFWCYCKLKNVKI